ncbi:MAG: hypothetical protein U0232_03435 [Thermomicrobiales bacterium]
MSRFKSFDVVLAALVAGGCILFQYVAESLDFTHGAGLALAILAAAVIVGAAGMFIYDRMVTNPVEVGSTEVPQPDHRRASSSATPARRRSGWWCASSTSSGWRPGSTR